MRTLREKVENAVSAYLNSAVGGNVRYLTGLGDFEGEFPAVVSSFVGAEEIHADAHHWNVEVLGATVSSANPNTETNAAAAHGDLVGRVVSALEVEGLHDFLMSADPDLLVNGIISSREEQPDIDERNDQPVFSSGYTITFPAGHK